MKIRFARMEAAHAFASMAEGMEEVQRDDGDTFEADQLAVMAQAVWDRLGQDNHKTHPWWVDIGAALDTANNVRENCEDNVHGRNFHADMVDDEDKENCYVGECLVPGESVAAYFEQEFGVAPRDASMTELPSNSGCGNDCIAAIDAARAYCVHADMAGPHARKPLLDSINKTLITFLHG